MSEPFLVIDKDVIAISMHISLSFKYKMLLSNNLKSCPKMSLFCFSCFQFFFTYKSFRTHLKTHGKQSCPKCSLKFQNSHFVQVHLKLTHSNSIPALNTSIDILHSSQDSDAIPSPIVIDIEEDNTLPAAEEHLRDYKRCPVCQRPYKKASISNHLRAAHNIFPLQCNLCEFNPKFRIVADLKAHLRGVHGLTGYGLNAEARRGRRIFG